MAHEPWSPDAYLTFADHRLRPALEMLARVPLDAPVCVVDLGCGTGALTRAARARWPTARVIGVDSSAEMLDRARVEASDGIDWREADIAAWTPAGDAARPDLILSNAALHWLGDHDRLIPRLLKTLRPGGVLAVQMPRNHDRPSHTLIKAVAADGPWAGALADLIAAPNPVDPPEAYARRLLAAGAESLDLWETDYQQRLTGGPEAIADFTGSTALRPWLARLPDDAARAAFVADYRARLRVAYPPLPDGSVLFPFRRLFLVARRSATPQG